MSNNCDFKICHLNVRSLTAHFVEFLEYFSTLDYDIITVSETWLTANIPINTINIAGYNFVRRDRERGGKGGGVGIYIKNSITFNLLENSENIEDIWVSFKIQNVNFALGCTYKPPNFNINNFLNEFENTLVNIIPKCDEIICLGDFNIDFLNVNSSATIHFMNLLDSLGLKQIVNNPTRITLNSASLLDYIILSEERSFSKCDTVSLPNISDHELVFVHMSFQIQGGQAIPRTYRDIKNIDENILYEHLQAIPWRNIFDIDNIDDKITFFNENMKLLMDIHAPLKTCIFKKPYKPWITDNIKLLINLKHKALQKFKRTRNPQHFQEYKDLKNFLTSSIRREKKAYLRHSLQMNTKVVWKAVKNLQIYNNQKNKTVPDNLANVNEINNYFINSIPYIRQSNNIINYYQGIKTSVNSILTFKTVTEIEISKHLLSVKSRAIGADGMHINFILLCCPFILKYICHIVNFCIINSVYPSDWKIAHVVPLPKINTPEGYGDLRPISILPVLSKILEYIIKHQIVEHVENNDVLPCTQSGFRKGHSCATALLNVTDYILRATDSGLSTVLVLLDYSKAFDTLNHKTLLLILKYVGFSTEAVNFIANYLKERKQKVVLNGSFSDSINIFQGVPQGSVLGPLLYTLYTSSLPTFIQNCGTQMYADDTQLYFSFNTENIRNSCELINKDLEIIYKISLEHSLTLNPNKCIAMLFTRPMDRARLAQEINIKINDIPVPITEEAKNLGLIVDTSLRFDKHISNCIKRAIARLKVLYSSRHILNTNLKIILCDSLVLSIFNYCDTVYGPCLTAANSARIQKIQNYCLRFIYGIRRREPISHKLQETKWFNMKNRRHLHSSSLYHKIIITNMPSYLYSKITFRTDVHNLNVRFKGTLTPPVHRTTLFERSFSFNICRIYNSLPPSLKSRSVSSFSQMYKRIFPLN